MKRTLSLRREALAELTTEDLATVVGGASGLTCPVKDCLADVSDAVCPSRYNCQSWECTR